MHTKCPYCSGKIYHFGGRRRRCSQCGRTWSVRPQKRGRKPLRTGPNLPRLILLERHNARQLVPRYDCSAATLRYRAREHMRVIAERPGQLLIPEGDLVLLVDGLWSTFQDHYWVLYNMAVKPVTENVATCSIPFSVADARMHEAGMRRSARFPGRSKNASEP